MISIYFYLVSMISNLKKKIIFCSCQNEYKNYFPYYNKIQGGLSYSSCFHNSNLNFKLKQYLNLKLLKVLGNVLSILESIHVCGCTELDKLVATNL